MFAGRRIMMFIAAIAALGLIAGIATANKPKHKTVLLGKVTHHTNGTVLDPAILSTKFAKRPRKGSFTVKFTAVNDNPSEQNLIYVSGGMDCFVKGKQHSFGATKHHVKPPFTVKPPFPYKVTNPDRCRINASSNFDPDPAPPIEDPIPKGTITIKVLWRK